MSMREQANNLITLVNHKLTAVRNIEKYMNFQTRLRYADAHLVSLINYGMLLYVNENQAIKLKLHKCILRVGRWVHGNYCYKRSIKSIMEQLNWKIPEEQIEDSAARFFQKDSCD